MGRLTVTCIQVPLNSFLQLFDQFYSDGKINSYMYNGPIEFIFAIICMRIT